VSDDQQEDLMARVDTSVPVSARIWNYWMGGKDNFQADRAAGDAVVQVYPEIAVMARESRQFLGAAMPGHGHTTHLAAAIDWKTCCWSRQSK